MLAGGFGLSFTPPSQRGLNDKGNNVFEITVGNAATASKFLIICLLFINSVFNQAEHAAFKCHQITRRGRVR